LQQEVAKQKKRGGVMITLPLLYTVNNYGLGNEVGFSEMADMMLLSGLNALEEASLYSLHL
jgi:hypothetical protein